MPNDPARSRRSSLAAALAWTLLGACSDGEAPPAPGLPTAPTLQPTPVRRPEPTGPCGQGLPTAPDPEVPTHTPRWAFEPWISKDISDAADTYAFVDGFAARGIPVGVVVLDSPWETNYNSLVANPNRYPDFAKMVGDLRARDIRTVLWLTPLINTRSFDFEPGGDRYADASPNYEEALACHFFVNDGQEVNWWKGKGSALDFANPAAMAWWHWQIDKLLVDQGVAGFKLDFGDSYVRTKTVQTAAGEVAHQDYSESYYHDFYRHGVAVRGPDEHVTMVRPYDKSYDFEGRFYARPEDAPTAWVGDNRRDWFGLNDALDHIFRSAAAGYVVVGSDIGGYLDRNDENLLEKIPEDSEVFLRWTALGALTPFMELHGRANLTPWTVPGREEEAVAAWRYWATLHRELVPFFYSLAEEAYREKALPIVRPEGPEASWPGDYRFSLGDAFLVAPMVAPGGQRSVALPPGSFIDWWTGEEISGDQTLLVSVPEASRIPLYLRRGAIVPLAVTDDVTGLGDASSTGSLTVLIYPGPALSRFVVHEDGNARFAIEAKTTGTGAVSIEIDRAPQPLLLRVRGSFGVVRLGGEALPAADGLTALNGSSSGFWRDDASRSTWIRLPAAGVARTVEAAP